MNKNSPIGIFDSGVGGLTVVDKILKALPREDIVYFGDTARVPYGTKSKKTVTRFAKECLGFLARFRVKMVIIACNTASSLSLAALKKSFGVPIIGVIKPGVKAAVKKTRNNKIGVIGTKATVSSKAYNREFKKAGLRVSVYQKACPIFVPLVESGWLNNEITENTARVYLAPLKAKKIDTLILGCTHYPLLKPVLKKVMGKAVKLVDSSEAIAEEVRKVLQKKVIANEKNRKGRAVFFVSDEPDEFKKIAKFFLKRNVDVRKASV